MYHTLFYNQQLHCSGILFFFFSLAKKQTDKPNALYPQSTKQHIDKISN